MRESRRLSRRVLSSDAATLAPELLGCVLVRVLESGERLSGVIVETEAYVGAADRACHSFGLRRTARNESMYAPPGTAYVYFTYGMHHCVNVVCGRAGEPVAVLLRAIEPVEGLERMRANRGGASRTVKDRETASGPGRLCQALALDRSHDGLDLCADARLWIEPGPRVAPELIGRSARIGVDSAGPEWAGKPLRFFIAGNPHVSGPRGARATR